MSACRFCGETLTETFIDLGEFPLSNAYLSESQLNNGREPFYPLHAFVCRKCLLVQLEAVQSPDHIFNNDYAYFSSYSDAWLKHARNYVEAMTSRFKLDPSHQVIEIASNDGYLLQYFNEKNIPVLGVEPAANVAEAAEKKGVPTLVKFFGRKTAGELKAEKRQADLLLGNNVLAHVPDINDFVAGLPVALKPTGVVTMEFPHLLNLIRHNQFDTIYHEHFSYLSFLVLEKILNKHGLAVFDVEEIPTHGGSLRVYACHAEKPPYPTEKRVALMKTKEKEAGLYDLKTYTSFQEKVTPVKKDLVQFLKKAKKEGKQVAGYGAPAKGNTLLHYCGVKPDLLPYTVDRSPHKQGRYLPGTHIPIYAPEKIQETKPAYVLILPWNIRGEIMEKMSFVRDWGGKFVVPIPTLKLI